jgi:hypothetical protein
MYEMKYSKQVVFNIFHQGSKKSYKKNPAAGAAGFLYDFLPALNATHFLFMPGYLSA